MTLSNLHFSLRLSKTSDHWQRHVLEHCKEVTESVSRQQAAQRRIGAPPTQHNTKPGDVVNYSFVVCRLGIRPPRQTPTGLLRFKTLLLLCMGVRLGLWLWQKKGYYLETTANIGEPGWLSQYSVWLRPGRPGHRGSIPDEGKEISPLASASRPALGPIHPPVQWLPRALSPGLSAARA
jgi:hypothetical protein